MNALQRHNLEVARARKHLWEKGAVESSALSDYVHRSWQRCLQRGLAPDHRHCREAPSAVELRPVLERSEALLRAAAPVMESLADQSRNTTTGILLTDERGVMLATAGDTDFLGIAKRVGARPGVCWNEADKGTNAMGTALAEKTPVVIHGSEHYLRANSIFTCTAAPIFDPFGNLIGSLDLSGHYERTHPHSLSLVGMSAQLIESYLLRGLRTRGFKLSFHPRPEFIGTLSEGMIVLDEDGSVIAANRAAGRLLGIAQAGIRGRPLGDLFDLRLEQLLALVHTANGALFTVPIHRRAHVYMKISDPGTAFAAREVAAVAQASASARHSPALPARGTLDELETGDAAIGRAIVCVRRVSGREVNILIEGETGTGKEVFARAIHAESAHRTGPFVAVNCAAIPEGLIESELFGYEEGAFTGARRKGSPGLVAQADGGTLFLDEIGDMPLHLQAKLLRVLERKEVVRLGGAKPLPVRFNLISATCQDVWKLAQEGRFRQDLYFRLKGVMIRLPALRARGDFDALVARVLRCETGEENLTVSPEASAILRRHTWPGNLRELGNVLRTAAAFLADGERELRPAHLPEELLSTAGTATAHRAPAAPGMSDLATVERSAVREAVSACAGNISAAARRLGVSRGTVYRKLAEEETYTF